MISDIKTHSTHYAVLGAWLSVGLFVYTFMITLPVLRFLVVLVFSLGYTIWGIIHHHLNRDLTDEIVLEYLLVSMFATVIFGSMLLPNLSL